MRPTQRPQLRTSRANLVDHSSRLWQLWLGRLQPRGRPPRRRRRGGARAARLFVGRGYKALEARSLALLGRCLVRQNREAAVERLREAVKVFDACGCRWRRDRVFETLRHLGKPGQRAVAASVGPESLTGREREVTALAMQGMSAKAIGELLRIGERTVESHLARVYLNSACTHANSSRTPSRRTQEKSPPAAVSPGDLALCETSSCGKAAR